MNDNPIEKIGDYALDKTRFAAKEVVAKAATSTVSVIKQSVPRTMMRTRDWPELDWECSAEYAQFSGFEKIQS